MKIVCFYLMCYVLLKWHHSPRDEIARESARARKAVAIKIAIPNDPSRLFRIRFQLRG